LSSQRSLPPRRSFYLLSLCEVTFTIFLPISALLCHSIYETSLKDYINISKLRGSYYILFGYSSQDQGQ
jgi:hypothetical protein